MGLQEPKEPGALGQPRKQRPIVACQPAIEGSIADAFERMQQPQGDDLAGPEMGLGVFGDSAQLLIDFIEQRGDKLHGHHTALLAGMLCFPAWKSRRRIASPKTYIISINSSIKLYGLLETNTIGL